VSDERQFPVLFQYFERKERPDCPRTVPWAMLAPHEAMAQSNHSQTLERLAERGGLGPSEIIAVLDGIRLRDLPKDRGDVEYVDALKTRIEAYRPTPPPPRDPTGALAPGGKW
jgi:hypothetical protein